MKRPPISNLAALAAASLIVLGCGQAAPPPTPTRAPAAPTKAAEPTKAPAVPTKAAEPTKAPTAAPTVPPKVDFPQKGRTITYIVPYNAGGATDVAVRVLAPLMEKELGVPVQVVNRPGAGAQVGLTELATAKPDGYTLAHTGFPVVVTIYLDPERKAVFKRDSFVPIATYMDLPVVSAVQADGPYKTIKDVVDAAKANPEKIKPGTTGLMGTSHLGLLQLEKAATVKFAIVHFDGGAPQMTALLGGHIDMGNNVVPEVMPPLKNNQIRPLAIMDRQESKFLPGVKTYESQGYKVVSTSPGGASAPAGTPREVVQILSNAILKATATDQFKTKIDELGFSPLSLGWEQFAKFWGDAEAEIKALMPLAQQK